LRIQQLTSINMPQLDLLSSANATLPDEDELLRRFHQFNTDFFKGKLPEATIRWSTRMRIAGTCHRHRALITLSRPYHERFPGDVDDTLKHEMIHLRYAGHGPAFRREAARVGASIHCREYEGIHPRAKLVYACPTCWREFRRSKPGELYCGRCSRGRLGPMTRLVLIREIETAEGAQTRPRAAAMAPPRKRAPRAKSGSSIRRFVRSLFD
jgi:predicted SprT family Zn-dependent metalloprotease